MAIEQFAPHRDGQPIGFVYQEPNHPPSYQVIKGPDGERVIQTSDLAELAKAAQNVPGIVWLNREQIAALTIPVGKEGVRPLTRKEATQLAA